MRACTAIVVEDVAFGVGYLESLQVLGGPSGFRQMLQRSHWHHPYPRRRFSFRASRCSKMKLPYARLARRPEEPA